MCFTLNGFTVKFQVRDPMIGKAYLVWRTWKMFISEIVTLICQKTPAN